ncbi:hypothetical protein [Thiorhodococcus mannitoliphagus]|uniref:hypothetical protein n=1 Tax=Thiorhodococcus mannitoliphagus TaxID=329406 RepID=UPI0030B8814F
MQPSDGPGLDTDQLPLNFPQTFLPDRRLLGKLLVFAEGNGGGDKESIGAATGIPTGKSTGKVEPMIHYARGMGMVRASRTAGVWRLGLTPLGRIVRREDPFLSEPLTLWLLHLLLSRRWGREAPAVGVADAWFAFFAEGRFRLGPRFSPSEALDFLTARHGEKRSLKSLSTLVPRMYQEDSSFAAIPVLTLDASAQETVFVRGEAPVERAFFPAYAACLFLLWDEQFSGDRQLAFRDVERETRLLSLLGWSDAQATRWLDWMADKGLVQIDRYTGDAVLLRLRETGEVVDALYSELL